MRPGRGRSTIWDEPPEGEDRGRTIILLDTFRGLVLVVKCESRVFDAPMGRSVLLRGITGITNAMTIMNGDVPTSSG